MVVLIVEKVSASLRGELTRWMLEPKTGVFVGTPSAMVRDKLWEKICQKTGAGGATMIHSASNEQGFDFRFWGATSRHVADWDGLRLITIPSSPTKKPSKN